MNRNNVSKLFRFSGKQVVPCSRNFGSGHTDQQSYGLSVGTVGFFLQGGGSTCGSGNLFVDGGLAVSNAGLKASSGTAELHGSCAMLYMKGGM